MYKVLILLPVIAVSMVLSAADVTFTNAGGDHDWYNPANWSGDAVPGQTDNVTIPEGHTCEIPPFNPTVASITNNGELDFFHGRGITSLGDFMNFGSITIGDGGGTFNIGGNFSNNGSIEGGDWIQILTDATSIINNNGLIRAGNGDEGGRIQCFSGYFNNSGTIQGGNAVCYGEAGGDVEIDVRGEINNHGRIIGGDGGPGDGVGGNVDIHGRNAVNLGCVEAGYSDGGWRKSLTPVAADVCIIADSICIDPGDSSLCGGTFHIRGRKLIFQNIDTYAGLIGENAVEIYTTATGTADFSGTHTNCALSSGTGGIDIYSDDIIAPTEGMDFICCPAPTTHASDASIVDGNISACNAIEFAGVSGNVKVFMQNLSTSAQVMYYDISSSKGWLTPTSGSTPSHAPFEFDSVLAGFTIPPSTADSIKDTVTAILSIAPSFAETTSCIIHCSGDSEAVYVSEKNHLPSCLTVQTYPNPFNSSVAISVGQTFLSVPASEQAGMPILPCEIEIYDLRGNVVWQTHLSDSEERPQQTAKRNGQGEALWRPDESIASGIYLVKARMADGQTAERKIMYLR